MGRQARGATAPVVEPVVAVSTTDLGDSVQFVRQTPFGPQKWTKKKTDLTENEKDYLKKDESRRPASGAKPDQPKPQPPGKNVEKPSAQE